MFGNISLQTFQKLGDQINTSIQKLAEDINQEANDELDEFSFDGYSYATKKQDASLGTQSERKAEQPKGQQATELLPGSQRDVDTPTTTQQGWEVDDDIILDSTDQSAQPTNMAQSLEHDSSTKLSKRHDQSELATHPTGSVSTLDDTSSVRISLTIDENDGNGAVKLHLSNSADVGTGCQTPNVAEQPKMQQPCTQGEETNGIQLQNNILPFNTSAEVTAQSDQVSSHREDGVIECQAQGEDVCNAQSQQRIRVSFNTQGDQQANDDVQILQLQLKRREEQLQRQAACLQDTQQQCNEWQELAEQLKQQVNESNTEALQSLRNEFEQRLSTLDKKHRTAVEERDKAIAAASKAPGVDLNKKFKEKEAEVEEVMEEGRQLSIKILEHETTIKNLRKQLKERGNDVDKLQKQIDNEKGKQTQTEAALQTAKSEIGAWKDKYTNDMAQRMAQHQQAIELEQANVSAAQQLAADLASQGLQQELQTNKASVEILAQQVSELREELDSSRNKASAKEDQLLQEMSSIRDQLHKSEYERDQLAQQLHEAGKPLAAALQAAQIEAQDQLAAWRAGQERSSALLANSEQTRIQAETARDMAIKQVQDLQQRLKDANASVKQGQLQSEEQQTVLRAAEQQKNEMERAHQQLQRDLSAAQQQIQEFSQLNQQLKDAEQQLEKDRQSRASLEANLTAARQQLLNQMNPALSADLHKRPSSGLQSYGSDGLADSTLHAHDSNVSVDHEQGPRQQAGNLEGPKVPTLSLLQVANSGDVMRAPSDAGQSTMYSSKGVGRARGMAGLQNEIRAREGELRGLRMRVLGLEKERDGLADELLQAQRKVVQGEGAVAELEQVRKGLEEATSQLRMAMEMVGERDEKLQELQGDVNDWKELYQDQIQLLSNQLQQYKDNAKDDAG